MRHARKSRMYVMVHLQVIGLCLLSGAAWAAGKSKEKAPREWKIPVVMEEATVRGKIVVLESRREDRHIPKDLKVQIWPDEATEKTDGKKTSGEKTDKPEGKVIYQTKTDEFGFFALPELKQGRYVLMLGELKLRLMVVPKAENRRNQDEPKVLLILMPKEVIRVEDGGSLRVSR